MSFSDSILITSNTDLKETARIFGSVLAPKEPLIAGNDPRVPLFYGDWEEGYYYVHPILTPFQGLVQELLGFSPNFDVSMHRANDVDFEIYFSMLIQNLLELIQKTQWEIAYVRGDSHVLLLYTSDGLIIRQDEADWVYWPEERLKMIKIPYTIGTINRL